MDSFPSLRTLKKVEVRQNLRFPERNDEDEQPLSPVARLFHQPGSNVYIVAIMGSKIKLQPDVIKPILIHALLKHPRFSSLQVKDKHSGELKWIPTKVDIENHVIVPELDPNMDGADEFVEDYLSNLSKTNIPNSKPLWDIHLLNVKTSEAEALIIYRIHHSIGDGMSLMALILAHSRQVSDPSVLPTLPGMNKKSNHLNCTGLGFVYILWNSLVAIFVFVLTAFFLKDTQTPLKGPAGVELKPRRFVRRTLNLQDFKSVKSALHCTINDVVLGVTQAGLSRYLNRRYGELQKYNGVTDQEKEKNYLPKNIRLRATFFFNLRASTKINVLVTDEGIEEQARMARFGNKIGYVILPFNIGIQADPLDYIRQAKAVIDRKKASLEPLFTYLFLKYFIKFFGIKAAGVICHNIFFNTTLWFSNVPGPQEEVSLYGHQMAFPACSCYGQPNALMIHVISYTDKITFVLSTDEDTIPDPYSLCDDLEESLKLIKAAVVPS
ncbi:wax ester synthase/diacylglycerol acyltransferase 11-like isoform X1 [Apium graveolens]|uniref:wax ester synthase/diacylglycerol acyltransferase 11-like isoform X1 n=1 Tax=Apium graveolens TaxID=4045 RepID=UPI003D79C774